MERENREGFAFFVGVMAGFLGNLIVSTLIESLKAIQGNDTFINVATWSLSFMISSAVFLQITKRAMRMFGISKDELGAFDKATAVFVFLGIAMIIAGAI